MHRASSADTPEAKEEQKNVSICRGVGAGRGSKGVWGGGAGWLAWNSAHEIFRCLPYLSTSCIICTFVLLIKDISQIRDTSQVPMSVFVYVYVYFLFNRIWAR